MAHDGHLPNDGINIFGLSNGRRRIGEAELKRCASVKHQPHGMIQMLIQALENQ